MHPTTRLDAECLASWRLIRTPDIGPVTHRRLLNRCGSARAALEQLPEITARSGRKPPRIAPMELIEKEQEKLLKLEAHILFLGTDDYPRLLAHIPDAPPLLFCLGNPDLLSDNALAIVGTRNPSASGLDFTRELARDLAKQTFLITSGLARGIDTAAHNGCLEAGMPTAAVVAGGIDHIYPPQNAKLRERIIEEGCVLSEAPVGNVPTARHFPRRNRIIAGLSRLVIVTEATRHSGSLITASYAGEYGREVYAVPGSPRDSRAEGPNHLLKQGAQFLESVDDILGNMSLNRAFQPAPVVKYTGEAETPDLFPAEEPEKQEFIPPEDPAATTIHNALFSLLSNVPVMPDDLIRQAGFPEIDAMIALSDLELDGKLKRQAGGGLVRG